MVENGAKDVVEFPALCWMWNGLEGASDGVAKQAKKDLARRGLGWGDFRRRLDSERHSG